MGWDSFTAPRGASTLSLIKKELGGDEKVLAMSQGKPRYYDLTRSGRPEAGQSVVYAAVRSMDDPNRIYAAVVLVKRRSGRFGFMYKFMDESMGPNEDEPSRAVLDALSPLPTEGGDARKWRLRAWAHVNGTWSSSILREE